MEFGSCFLWWFGSPRHKKAADPGVGFRGLDEDLVSESDWWSRKSGTPDTAGKGGVVDRELALDVDIAGVDSRRAIDGALTHDGVVDTAGGERTDPLDPTAGGSEVNTGHHRKGRRHRGVLVTRLRHLNVSHVEPLLSLSRTSPRRLGARAEHPTGYGGAYAPRN